LYLIVYYKINNHEPQMIIYQRSLTPDFHIPVLAQTAALAYDQRSRKLSLPRPTRSSILIVMLPTGLCKSGLRWALVGLVWRLYGLLMTE
jgi:hypothetical protein